MHGTSWGGQHNAAENMNWCLMAFCWTLTLIIMWSSREQDPGVQFQLIINSVSCPTMSEDWLAGWLA